MRVLLDCNVLLDVMDNRRLFVRWSAAVLDACEARRIQGALAWHTLSNAYYLAANKATARRFLAEALEFLEVPKTDTKDALYALRSPLVDFEDALQLAAARAFNAHAIITRNVEDFAGATIRAVSPENFCREHGLAPAA